MQKPPSSHPALLTSPFHHTPLGMASDSCSILPINLNNQKPCINKGRQVGEERCCDDPIEPHCSPDQEAHGGPNIGKGCQVVDRKLAEKRNAIRSWSLAEGVPVDGNHRYPGEQSNTQGLNAVCEKQLLGNQHQKGHEEG